MQRTLLWTSAVLSIPLFATQLPAAEESLFRDGEDAIHFRLAEVGQADKPSPEKELLHQGSNKQAIATLLKEERNKSIKPGLTPPDDADSSGIKIRFDGVRFIKDPQDPNLVRVRLIGPINEVECSKPLQVQDLLNSEKSIPVQFKSVTQRTGVRVTILTDLHLRWNKGELFVHKTAGSIDFRVGFLSPARLLYNSDFDRVALPELAGKRVAVTDLPYRTLLDPAKL